MKKDELKQGFEKVKTFYNNNATIIQYVLLALIIILAVFIRAQPIDNLFDQTSGKHISLELDSTLFYRYAQDIAQDGELSNPDTMRAAPFGRETRFYEFFTSYFVAYLWKILHVFNSSLTVEYVDIIYPLVAMSIFLLFLFLLVRRLFGARVGLLAALIVSVLPAFLYRSVVGSSDHDILIAMFVVMAFYFYFVGWESKRLISKISLGAIAGIITFLAMATGGAGRFILLTLGVLLLVRIFLDILNFEEFILYLSFIIPFSILMQFFGTGLEGVLVSLSTSPAYFALIAAAVYIVLFDKKYFKINYLDKFKEKVPSGIIALISAFILGIIFAIIFLGWDVLVRDITNLYNNLFRSYQFGRVGLTVAENRKSYLQDLFSGFGRVYVWAFLASCVILFYKAIEKVEKKIKIKLVLAFAAFILLFSFSRFSPNTIFNGQSLISIILGFGSLLLFMGVFLYYYLSSYRTNHDLHNSLKSMPHAEIFMLIWALVMFLLATTAIRFLFEFSLVIVIMAALFLVFLFHLIMKIDYKPVKIICVVILILFLFNPISFSLGKFSVSDGILINDYKSTLGSASGLGPAYNPQWQLAGGWVRENTPVNSTFVSWWDYGYWIQSGFNRPAVTDGGHPYTYWDHLVGREFLTAPNLTEPLKFLNAHDVDYALILADDIGKYSAFASIGSGATADRYSYLPIMGLDSSLSRQTRNGTLLFYTGQLVLEEDFRHNGRTYPKNQAAIAAVTVPLLNLGADSQSVQVKQPSAILVYGSEQIELKLRCVYIDKMYEFSDYDYNGCIKVIPTISGQETNNFGAAIFTSSRVTDTLFARLYLFDEANPYFELAYEDTARTPLLIYNGILIGPIKIWKVNYPDNFVLTPEEKNYYLSIDYPDKDVDRAF